MLKRGPFVAGLSAAALAAGHDAARADGPLRVGASPTDAAGEAFYAVDQGFFRAAGLDVELTILGNGPSLAAAVSSGAIDIAFSTVSPLAEAHVRGINFRVIAPALVYGGVPTNVLLVAKDSPVQKAADLNGKVVAASALRDLTMYAALAWIDQNGGDVKSLKIIEMPFAQMGAALAGGRIAAASGAEPFITAARDETRVLANVSAAVAPRYMVAGWFATDAWLQANGDAAKRFAGAIAQTARWANTHQQASATILTRYIKLPAALAATIMRATYGEGGPEPALIQPVLDVATKYGGLPHVSVSDLIWRAPA